jgi:hypothetical protein
MLIPPNALIPMEKLTDYLLVPRRKNDKAQFLARAGFTSANPSTLEQAIRQLIAQNEAVQDQEDEYGTFYRVTGELRGPRGILMIVTVWMLRVNEYRYRFVTLKPAR